MVEQPRIYWVIGGLLVALLGLLGIQYHFYQNTLTLKEAEFKITANRALADITRSIERADAKERLSRSRKSRHVIERLDSIQRVMSSGWNRDDGYFFKDTVVITEDGTVELSYSSYHEFGERWEDLVEFQHDLAIEQSLGETWLDDMFSGMMDLGLWRPIQERVRYEDILEISRGVFREYGINAEAQLAIFDREGRPVIFEEEPDVHALAQLANSAYRARLFPDAYGSQYHSVHLRFPEEKKYVSSTVWPLLLTSGVLVMCILGAFAMTVTIIFRQKQLSLVKNDFINNMTHELKTPVSTIALACEALSDPDMRQSESASDRFVGMIQEENKRLGSLIENVLHTALVDRGEIKLKPSKVDMHLMIREAVDHLTLRLERMGGHVDLELLADSHELTLDPIHIKNVLDNLLDNAMKYSSSSPELKVTTSTVDGRFQMTVIDKGIGIARNELDRIFDTLYRVPTGNTHDVKGFGLGLSYVKAIVEKHGGYVSVKSKPGEGSAFSVNLPMDSEHGTEDTTSRGRPESGQIAA
jgi:two-component system phosphate regulon sensor histidine kinase PhoR